MGRAIKVGAGIACVLAIYAVGVLVRWGVMDVQEARAGHIPFTMESALAFHYGELAARSELPQWDAKVGYPEGLRPLESHNILAPVFWGTVYAVINHSTFPGPSIESFFHRITAPVYCLGILALFACVWAVSGGLMAPALAALSYAILIPSVMRSTGQEWLSENFSLPLLWTHLAFLAAALRWHKVRMQRAFFLGMTASALSLAGAWVLWDMAQVYLWLFAAAWLLILRKSVDSASARGASGIIIVFLLAAVACDPYLRAHVFAPRDSYNHFLALLWHKIKFLNVKPADPTLLPYEVRALWVPALHSATWERIWGYYGPAFLVWCAAMMVAAIRWLRGTLSLMGKASVFCGIATWIMAVFFVRMEVFWVFFAALGLAMVMPQGRIGKPLWVAALSMMLLAQAHALTRQAPALGRDVDYRALHDIVDWVKKRTPEGAVILASYSLSPSFAAYASRSIVLQPKYETALFRDKIMRFEHALMAEQESAFYSLCKTWGVRYYVHSKGFYADRSVNSFRYLVGVPQPSKSTNLIKFEINPKLLNYFRLLYQNDKYLIYRVVDSEDLQKSDFCLRMAKASLAGGFPARALRWSYRALGMNPGEEEARLFAIRSYSSMGDVEGARREAASFFGRMEIQKIR